MSGTTTDPTLFAKESLKDSKRWVVVRNVPVFSAHRRKVKRKNRDTGEVEEKEIVVTEKDLRDIVSAARDLERDTGAIPGLWLGHRNPDPDYPEDKQPPMVGLAPNWRIGKWGPKQKTAVLVDLYYDKRHWDEARHCPYRSAEYYPGQEITGVALLKRDPQLDLGMILNARRRGEPVLYMADDIEEEEEDTDPTKRPKAPPAFDKTRVGEHDDEDEDEDEDEDKEAKLYKKKSKEEKRYKRFAKCMKRYMGESGMAFPPATGTAPMPDQERARLRRPAEEPADRLSRTADTERYRRMEDNVQKLKKKLEKQEKDVARRDAFLKDQMTRYARNEASLLVEKLLNKGVQIKDPQALGEKLAAMPDREREDYALEIETNWTREPLGEDFLDTREAARYSRPASTTGYRDSNAGKDDFSDRDLQNAEVYMRQHANDDLSHEELWEKAEKYAIEQRFNGFRPNGSK